MKLKPGKVHICEVDVPPATQREALRLRAITVLGWNAGPWAHCTQHFQSITVNRLLKKWAGRGRGRKISAKCQDSLGQPRLYKKSCLKTKKSKKKKEENGLGLINRECAWIQASVTPRTRETGWKIGQCLRRFVLLQKLANSGKQIYFNFYS